MTTPLYPFGWAAGSQVRGDASPVASDPDYAWNVNFNNGNVNSNNRNNTAWVRPVRGPRVPGECQGETGGAATFDALYGAMRRAARNKKCSANRMRFMGSWIDGLLDLEQQINAGTWRPGPTMCFVAQRPKAREIHAPDFADRVVHHWLVPQLEAVFEPGFVHDSFANRRGKGTHAAVQRLHQFVREVDSGQGGGWYLQLDVANFFNRIHRPTLWRMLRERMARAGVPMVAQQVCHALLRAPVRSQGVVHRATAAERARVPAHKRLENAPEGCGIAIGNLSSQFFANAYLDRLDQFAKHTLRAPRYLRYVDDFVLVHRDRAQLEAWLPLIREFLQRELRLDLKGDVRLQPLRAGVDFLGYVVFPHRIAVRRRVVAHAHESLAAWGARHVRGAALVGTPSDYRDLMATLASFRGHLRHASARRLEASLTTRFPWLRAAAVQRTFAPDVEGKTIRIGATTR